MLSRTSLHFFFAKYYLQPAFHYSQRRSLISQLTCDDATKNLTITWENGKNSRFPYVWLRDNIPTNITGEHMKHLVDVRRRHLVNNSALLEVSTDKTGLKIQWDGFGEAHYSAHWLREHDISNAAVRHQHLELQHKTRKTTWNRDKFTSLKRVFDWYNLLANDRLLYDALCSLDNYGFLFLTNMPQEPGQGDKLKKVLGYYQHSYYGEKFQVKAKPDPSNLSYTPAEVGFHLDLPSMETLPEVQCLHFIQAAKEGGENTFVDGFEVADQIKRDKPDYFHILTNTLVEYVDDICDEGTSFIQMARHPVIRLDEDGSPKNITWSNHLRSWFYDIEPEDVPRLYEAFKTFHEYCHRAENIVEQKLNSGEAVIFDNLRLLHGRKAYKMGTNSPRHLEGYYFPWDAIKSQIRVLLEKLEK
jgi:gamma-butyrobetaine dioxygenase